MRETYAHCAWQNVFVVILVVRLVVRQVVADMQGQIFLPNFLLAHKGEHIMGHPKTIALLPIDPPNSLIILFPVQPLKYLFAGVWTVSQTIQRRHLQ